MKNQRCSLTPLSFIDTTVKPPIMPTSPGNGETELKKAAPDGGIMVTASEGEMCVHILARGADGQRNVSGHAAGDGASHLAEIDAFRVVAWKNEDAAAAPSTQPTRPSGYRRSRSRSSQIGEVECAHLWPGGGARNASSAALPSVRHTW